jgi:hypothetical protein
MAHHQKLVIGVIDNINSTRFQDHVPVVEAVAHGGDSVNGALAATHTGSVLL